MFDDKEWIETKSLPILVSVLC